MENDEDMRPQKAIRTGTVKRAVKIKAINLRFCGQRFKSRRVIIKKYKKVVDINKDRHSPLEQILKLLTSACPISTTRSTKSLAM